MNRSAFTLPFMSADNFCTSESLALLDCRVELVNLVALHRINIQRDSPESREVPMSMLRVLLLLPAMVLTACSQTPPPNQNLLTELDGPLAQMQVDGRQLYQRMQKLTLDKSCTTDQQCQVLGIGSRPCGGPEQFLLFSTQQTDQKMLTITNDRYSRIRQEQQQRLGLRSTCQQLIAPVPACRQQQCVLLDANH